MKAFSWSLLPLLLLWSACQPIVIGAPAEKEASAAAGQGGQTAEPPVSTAGEQAMGGQDAKPATGCDAARGLTISGHLTTPLGQAIVGARVRLSGENTDVKEARTNQNGDYELAGLCAGRYRLSAPCVTGEIALELTASRQQDLTGKPGACDEAALEPNVLLLVYDPVVAASGALQRASTVLKAGEPSQLADGLADFLSGATNGHVRPKLIAVDPQVTFPPRSDGASYSAEQYQRCLANAAQCLPDVAADIASIRDQEGLCAKVWQSSIDEIWLLGGPHFGLSPVGSLECTFAETGFVKHVDVIGLEFTAGLASVVSGYQERSHRALLEAFSAPSSDGDDPYAVFTTVAGQASATGCGSPGWAPNSSEPGRFDDPKGVPSICESFTDYPRTDSLGAPAPLTGCEAWGCTELGFARYWFAHLPRARWLDDRGRLTDFWRYVGRPDERRGIASGAPLCSSSYKPGWCSLLIDGEQSKCNDSEWATKLSKTGYVEFFYDPPRLVTGVTLYDRRCSEQVLAGHVEFSDGSEPRTFGPLDNGSAENNWLGEPETLPFEPKLLSGLRVVIDASQGENPGFAEIVVTSAEP